MKELQDFFNDGTGWVCRYCDRETPVPDSPQGPSRLMSEGEAETKSPEMANPARAKWADPAHRYLICPRCGIRELADKG